MTLLECTRLAARTRARGARSARAPCDVPSLTLHPFVTPFALAVGRGVVTSPLSFISGLPLQRAALRADPADEAWQYCAFIMGALTKDDASRSPLERACVSQIERDDISWMPIGRSLRAERR